MELMTILIIGIVVLAILIFIVLAALYTIVPADYADVVIQSGKIRVFSSHKEYSAEEGKSAYFRIPSWFFLFKLGMEVHRIPLKIIDIQIPSFLAFDQDRARFECNIIAYVTVVNPVTAAKRFSGNMQKLYDQISKVVQATTRDATTKKAIREIINDREGIIKQITPQLKDALAHWGLDLSDIELVEFKDPSKPEREGEQPSHVISDISSIIEEQINSEARQKNAEQRKTARLKEAIADEEAQKREIQRDEEVGKRRQDQEKAVFGREKEAREAKLEVERVQRVKTQEIEKSRQLVEAAQRKEVEAINKQQKQLVGEGDRIMKQEQAKGEAARIFENLKAEAEGKEKLQEALNKFTPEAIRALIAQDVVKMQEVVGVAGAKALEKADLRMFAGSDDGKGFDVGKMISSTFVSNDSAATAIINRLSRPNDFGFSSLTDLMAALETVKKQNEGEKSPSSSAKKK